jgi:hypothetical protein
MPGLAEPVTAILCLGVVCRHPVEVLKDDVSAGGERDADAARDDVADRDENGGIGLKLVNRFHALRGGL